MCPDTFVMSSRETLPIAFDVSPLLEEGETPSSPESSLVQIDNGVDYVTGRPGAAFVQGEEIVQTVTGLRAGKRYLLAIQFEAAPGKIWAPSLYIECPE